MFSHEDAHADTPRHAHGHHHQAHGHTHGTIEASLLTTQRGIATVQRSLLGLLATALVQAVIVWFSGSVALLADTIHNVGDAGTAIPLWIAFALAHRQPSRRFTYGYGRVEDLAGGVIVLIILGSAIVAGYTAVERLLNPQPVQYLGAVSGAALVGFLGNEAVAIWRIKVGKEIGSAALVADGYHARIDGLTSLAVLGGALGVWLGYPLADPLVGLLITAVIGHIVWLSGKAVFTRLIDGVDPEIVDEIRHVAYHTPGVQDATEVRARWLGHQLHAELNIAVASVLSVQEGHDVAKETRHRLLHHLQYLSNATVHVDPVHASGEVYHGIAGHAHDGLPPHSH